MDSARTEIAKIMAKNRIAKALCSKVPAADRSDIKISSEVIVCKEKPINKWMPPFTVLDVKGKAILVDMKGTNRQISVDKEKLYFQATQAANPTEVAGPPTTANTNSDGDIMDDYETSRTS